MASGQTGPAEHEGDHTDLLRVDLVTGKRTSELYGVSRYITEIYSRNKHEADFKIIDYCVTGKTALGNSFGLLSYPVIVARKMRTGSLLHVGSLLNAYVLNFIGHRPSIVTCHDIYPLLPREYSFRKRIFLRFSMRGMKRAELVICDSRFARDELMRLYGIPAHRIRVIYLGVDHDRFRLLPRDRDTMRRYGFADGLKTILYVGLDQPRKNLSALFSACRELLDAGLDVRLLKVGRPQQKEEGERLRKQVGELGLGERVVFTGYVPEEDLPHLYNLSDLFVFPSFYEGFGLPPLEAMACGCPVITSNTSSLPEVVGDAAIMLDPYDVAGLAGKMKDVLLDPALSEELRQRGLKRAERFSWDRTAMETLRVYREVMGRVFGIMEESG